MDSSLWVIAGAALTGALTGPLTARAAAAAVNDRPEPEPEPAGSSGALTGASWLAHPATGAAVFAGVGWAVGPTPALPAFLALGWVAIALALTDLTAHRMPNQLLGAGFAVIMVLLTIAAAIDGAWDDLARAGLAAGALFAFYAIVWALGGWGGGDVKYAIVLGLCLGWLGWRQVQTGTILAAPAFLLMTLLWRRNHRYERGSQMPYGPAMGAAAVAAILLS